MVDTCIKIKGNKMKKKNLLLIGSMLVTAHLSASNLSSDSNITKDISIVGCYGCHGNEFERKAMGKSLIVKDMNSSKVYTELLEYKSGTLNKQGMGGLMKIQTIKYTDKELKRISELITKG